MKIKKYDPHLKQVDDKKGRPNNHSDHAHILLEVSSEIQFWFYSHV